jgi:hypothetical protein
VRPRRSATLIALAVGIAFGLIAFLVLRGGPRQAATGLAVGSCFDVPAAPEQVRDIRPRPCTEPHGAEAFHAFDQAAGASTGYPSDTQWEQIIYPVCDPVFETYVGIPVGSAETIDYRYFVPAADRWAAGERHVTCFIESIDGKPLTRSYRGAP